MLTAQRVQPFVHKAGTMLSVLWCHLFGRASPRAGKGATGAPTEATAQPRTFALVRRNGQGMIVEHVRHASADFESNS